MPVEEYARRYAWDSAADWDNTLAQDDVEHEVRTDKLESSAETIEIGQPDHALVTSSDEAFYRTGETDLVDVTGGNDPVVQVTGTPQTPTVKFSHAVEFDDDGDLVYIKAPLWQTGTLVAFEAWVNPRAGGAGAHPIMNKQGMWSLRWDNDTAQGFDVSTTGAESGAIGPSGLAYGEWHHVNCYWDADADEIGMSVNGASFDTVAVSDAMTNRDAPTFFGTYSATATDWFSGQLATARCVSGQVIPVEDSLYQTDGSLTTAHKP